MKLLKQILSILALLVITACGSGNQDAIDDFFGVGEEDEAASGVITFSTKEFREAVANDGSIENQIDITLKGRAFTGAVGEEYVGSKLIITNLPAGLLLSVQFVDSKKLTATVTGNATSHSNLDDIGNVTFDFDDSAFNQSDNIAGKQSLVAVNYRDPYALTYDKSIINESGDNDGSVIETFNVSVNDLEFDGALGEDFVGNGKVSISNVPAGLTGQATKVGANIVSISLSGNATSHITTDDVSNLTVIFNSPAFPSGVNAAVVGNTTVNNLGVNFYDPATISYLPVSETFSEAVANVGAIGNQLTVSVIEDTFSGSIGEDYIASGKVVITNVPTGLTAQAQKLTANDVSITLSGQAASHINADDIANLGVAFSATAFDFNTNIVNVNNAVKSDISVDFLDPYVLSFDTKTFTEHGDNNGTIGTTVTGTLSGINLAGNVGDDFIVTGLATAANLPSGLTAQVQKTSANTVQITLSGTALNHESVNDISNVNITFLDTAFTTGVAAGVQGAVTSDFAISYRDPVTLSYSGEVFFESNANDGTISNQLDITLANDLFTGTNGENFLGNGKASITPSPVTTGLTAVLEKVSDTQVRLRLDGTAVSHDLDISGITLTFNASAFVTSTSTASINGAVKSNISVDFLDILTYASTSVMERAQNDGQIDQSVNVSLTGTEFTGSNGDNLVALGKVVVTNVPSGLAAVVTKTSNSLVAISFTGTALNHEVANDVTNIGFAFQNTAFTSGNSVAVTNNSITNFTINYLDPVTVAYDTNVFVEAAANDGSIDNTITLTLSGDTFTGNNGDEYIGSGKVTLSPAVPAGLTASLTRTSSTTLAFNLVGNAASHDADVGPFTLTLDASAFTINTDTTGIVGVTRNDIQINYNDALAFSTKNFTERAENDGQIDTTSVVTLTGTTFTGSNGDDFIAGSKVLITNLPVGLTASLTRNSATQLTMSITGTAASHTSADDIANLSLTFNNSAFASGIAGSVANSTVSDMTIAYLDPVSLSYATDTFNENSANDGSIQNSIDITLANDIFTGSNGDDFIAAGKVTANNVPVGLTAEIRRISDTVVRASLIGNAASHAIDISNLEFIFNASAFTTTTNTLNVVNETKSDLTVNYYDTLAYSTKTVTERALNDGIVSETITLQISGTVLAGSNGDDFVALGRVLVSNVPSGLTAVMTRNSSTQLTLAFTGTAATHESADSVSNVTVSFLDSALSGSTAATLENATVNDVAVNFFDSVAISYSGDTFTEALANDGSISNTLTLTIVNDTLTGTNGEDFLSNSKAIALNVPAGLTATLVRASATTLQLNLTGNAINHGDIHDVSNLSIEVRDTGLVTTADTTNVLNAVKADLKVDYISPSVLNYDSTAFAESSSNDGAIANAITIDIDGLDSFTGNIGDDFIAGGKVSVSNIPSGLTATVEKTASKQVRFVLSGNALAHESANSVANVTIAFTAAAFTFNNNVSLVGNNNLTNIQVNYQDAASIAYSVTTFAENIANVGQVDTVANIDLANDTFLGSNGEDFLATGKAVITNVPAGLSPTLTRTSATRVQLAFSGNAVSHANANDIANLTLNFQPSAFSFNTDTTTIVNAQRNNLVIDFADPYTLAYSGATFTEIAANTGVLSGTSSITITGTTFSGSNGDDFASNGKVVVSNLPAGLTAVASRTSANQVDLTITGNATNHANVNDISNLTIAFQSSAFTSGDANGVTGSTKSDFILDFIDPYTLSFDTVSVSENVQNVGTITEVLTITLGGHQFTGSNGDDFVLGGKVVMANVPAGLTVTAVRDSNTQLTLSYTGTAAAHTNAEDISNIQFTLQDSALTSSALAADVVGYNPSNLAIDFLAPYTLSANGFGFNEAGANDGSVTETITYTLVGTTFAGANGRDLVADGHVTMTNVPAGLTAVVTKIDTNNVTLSFTGTATNHAVVNNSANTDINFLAGAFTSGNASGVTPNNFTALSFSWDDPPALSYSPTTFNESTANIGGTTTSVSIFASNKTFNGTLGENFVAGGKVTVSSHPAGLTPVVTYASPNQVNLTFTGNATNNDDVHDIASGITVVFADSAFVGGNAAQVVDSTFNALAFDFLDPYQISYASSTFAESSLNDGSVANTLSVTLAGTLFTGNNGDDFVAGGKATVNNVPAGLTATVTKLSSSLLSVALSGTATNHEASDSISNLEVVLADTAFNSGAAAGVNNSTKSDINITFNDTAVISYASSTFNEEVGNVGDIDNSINITIANDTFNGPDGENFISTGKVAVSNVPVGLIAEVTKVNNTTLSFSFSSRALAHENVHDISNVTLTFAGSAFSFNSNAAAVTGSVKSDFAIDFMDAYDLAYGSTNFNEAAANDGSITDTVVMTLTGTTFTGSNGDDFVAGGKVTVTNVPAGLTAVINRDSATQATMSFTGNATSHANSNDITNVTVIYADTAFTSGKSEGVTNYSRSDLSVDFDDPPFLTYVGGTFNEAVANTGGISSTVDVTLTNATFSGTDGDFYTPGTEVTFSNVPTGLTAVAQKINATTVRFSFTGNATSHSVGDSITNFGVQFNNAAFNVVAAANITGTSKSDYAINFINPYSISYGGNTFNESVSNIGAIDNSINITLVGTTFTGTNGDIYTNGVQATFLNLPSGLTPVLQKVNDTTLNLSFTGAASSHGLANSITNFGISLQDSAFTSGAAAGVSNNSKIDFNVTYIDPYSITYSLPGFQESSSNNGQIGTTVDVDLTGTTFTGVNGSNYTSGVQYTVANVPAGLTAVVFKSSNTKLTVFFTGTAAAHEDANDISNFTLNLLDAAFTSGAAAGVLNNSKSDFFVDYISAATLAYSGATFNEAVANTGSIGNTLTLTLSNDTFTGINGENYVSTGKVTVANVPAGLVATVTKASDTTVTFALTGNASANLNSDDIANLTLTFTANAFSFNSDATTITNYTKNDIAVDYIDQYSLAYAPGTFTEGAANDGSIGNNIIITLTGSNFTTTATNFIAEGKVAVTNIPTGLSASVVRDSATQLTLSLTGNASNNLDSNDISNLTVTFADIAFTTGAAAGVDNSTKSDIAVDFNDQPSIAYAGSTFTEADSNVGAITDTINVNLTNATFSGVNGSFYTSGVEFSPSNVPTGLTMRVQKISDTQVQISFLGGASSHAVANSITNLGILFNNAAFNTVAAANVDNNSKSDFAINFRDPYTLAYSGSTFAEAVANTGGISSTVNITVTGTTFTGTNGANYTNGVEYSFSNLPAGLGVQVQKVSSTVVQLSFTGAATSHAASDSISNFTLNFLNGAFTSGDANGVNDTTKADFALNFIDPYTIAYSAGAFSESGANDGSFTDTIDLDITGTTFTGTNGATYTATTEYTVANVPTGLTAQVQKINGTKLRLSLTGNAAAHAAANDISNLTINLLDAAFTSGAAAGVTGSSKNDIAVNFADNASLAYSGTVFSEAASNIGAIATTVTITLSNDTFAGLNGENYVSTGKASVTGLPAGLTGVITKTSGTTVDVTISGNATAHANANDISTVGVTFVASAFDFNTNAGTVTNSSRSDLDLDFSDPYTLAYSTSTFAEAAANNGSIGNSVVITLAGGANFTTTGSDFITEGKIAVTNVPAGLTANVVRDSATQLTLSLSGAATNHADSNDVSTLSVVFADTAFDTGAAAGVSDSTKTDFAVDFNDAPSLAYSASSLNEADANTGGITGQIDITLTNDTFTGTNGAIYTATEVNFTNVPAGLTAQIQKISNTVVRLTYTGSATAHAIANNVSNITLNFQNAAFTNVAATNIINSSKSDLALSFKDPYTLAYSTSAFNEALANDGSIGSTVDITLTGTTFTGTNGANYTATTEYTVANVPTGLTAVVNKVNDTTLRISFTGTASAHDDSDDISNFTINLLDAAFTSGAAAGVTNTTKADFVIDYLAPATLSYSGTNFNESNLNNGSITDTINIDIVNDTFTGATNSDPIGNGDIVVNNLPAGLTAVGQKVNSTRITVSLTGNATNHANAHDVSNIEFVFQASAFTNNTVAANVGNFSTTNISIDYEDPYVLSYSTSTLTELGTNNGAISDTIVINLTGTTFTGSNGDNFSGTKATITNFPTGLTPVLNKDNNNQLTLSFTGTAVAHANANDISNLTITFADSAFASGAAAGVDNSVKNDIVVDFIDLASIAYNAGTISEAGTNVGAMGNSLTLTLSNDIYSGTNGDDFAGNGNATVNNVPAGLTATLIRTSDTVLTLSLTGNATNHANANDISNLEVILAASAFDFNTNASLVTNSTKSDISVDYDDPYAITYSGGALAEAVANDGSITATLNLDLVGTTFTGNNSDNFAGSKAIITNVPSGLTAVLTRTSSSQLQLSFTGNATNNESTHSIANLTVTLNDSAFTSGAAAGVTNYVKNDIAINFDDKPILAYSHSALDEDVTNTGLVSTSLVIDLTGETFATGTFDTSKVTVTNVPAGMGFTVTRNSATQVQVDLTGSATNHAVANDISNLTVTFLDPAFDNVAAANITNSVNSTIAINFRDPYTLAFSGGTFSEAVSNDGAISTSITGTITGTGFNTPAVNMIVDGMVTVNNVPAGLNAVVTRDSGTQVTLTLTGNATAHASANDISNLEFIFNDTAFISGESDGVTGSTKSDFIVDYVDPASISYASATFSEDVSNNGTLPNTIDITLASDTFTGTVSDNFAGTKALITNVPAGLTATLTKISATVVRLALTGTATNHENVNDISNLTVDFQASAFTNNTVASNVTGYLKNDIVVDYLDAYQISYAAGAVAEDIANDGSISATIGISLTGTTFAAGTDFVAEGKVTVTNLPTGLTAVLTRVDGTNLTLSFTGNASVHEAVNSIANLGIEFQDSALTTGNAAGVGTYNKTDLAINYTDQAVISYSTDTFSESAGNDGTIGNSINISIANGEFTGTNGSDFVADSKVTITNLPGVYTATMTKISNTTLTLSLSGAAANGDHEDADDISNLTVDFNNTAVTSARADLVANETKSDLKIDYADVILPAIVSLTAPGDAYYTLAQTMTFTVAYSEDVDVTGTPRIVFDVGGTTKYATYQSGTGSSTLIFEYTTIASDQDLDGITISSSSIDLNGGTIKKKNDAINNALITFSVPNTSNVFVDTIDPNAISALAFSGGQNYTAVGSQSPTITWTNPTGPNDNINHIEIAIGSAAGANNIIDYIDIGNVQTYQFTGVSPDWTQCSGGSPMYYPVVRVHDDAGNTSSTISNAGGFLFDNIDPTNPSVTGTTFDATNTASATITWTAGSDACGIASYEMAIGQDTNANGSLDASEVGNVVTWTDVGNVLSARLTGLTLTDNTNYYTSIRTVDITGRNSGAVGVTSARWRSNFNYRRDVTITPATSVADSHVKVVLNSGNFTYANAQSDLSDLRFFTTGDVALDYWIEYHDATDETIIWVKVPATSTSTIVMKYGTVNLADGQDKDATFSFATAQALYVEPSAANSNQPMNIASYINGNSVTVSTASPTTNFTINENDVQAYTNTDQGVILANGGISGRTTVTNRAYEGLSPLSEAATVFGYSVSRNGTDRYRFYNPNSTSATVTTTAYTAAGAQVGTIYSTVVAANSFGYLADADSTNNGIVILNESTLPVIGFYSGGNNNDGNVQPQASTELYGVPSTQGWIGCTANSTNFTVYRSSNSIRAQDSYSCSKGQRINISDGSYAQGIAPSIRLISNNPVFGTSQADSDGSESAAFMPRESLDTEYIIPGDSEYIVMGCPYPSTSIEVFDETGTSVYTASCNASGNFPGKEKVLASQFSLTTMPAGYRVTADKPFFIMYEFLTADETSAYGSKSARKYLETPLATSVSGTEY